MISYSPDGITITDDRDPARAALVLPANATPTDVEAAVTAYLQPVANSNFDGFGLWLLTNDDVKIAFNTIFDHDRLTSCSLPSAVLAAAGGEPKHLRATLLLLRRQGLLSSEVLSVILAKAVEFSLPSEFLQALGG